MSQVGRDEGLRAEDLLAQLLAAVFGSRFPPQSRPLDLVLLDFIDEVTQRLGRLRIGAMERPCLGDMLTRSGILTHGYEKLPLTALALGLVLLELDD